MMGPQNSFPPYGLMTADLEDLIGKGVEPPPHWHTPADWPGWHLKLIDLYNLVLWPTFDQRTGTWRGLATQSMEALTRVDFKLMKPLRGAMKESVPLGGGSVTQMELFVHEDLHDIVEGGKIVAERTPRRTLRMYLATHADQVAIDALSKGYIAGLVNKSGHFGLELKRLLQRPRAYQMSLAMGETGFSREDATSAVTPAMISGHCMQFCMAGIASFYEARKLGVGVGGNGMLQQHTVDVGDRRVFAGVHYPSDNISSWIMSLLMQPKVCPDTDGHTWLWEAISTRSRVYAAIDAELSRDPNSPYAPSMRVLKKLGVTPGMTVDEALAFAAPGS